MFYSHTFLARKGPLGTVWFAAHLEKKLKKSQCTATDIPSTVDRIMFPEVPLALRMSGHLLLGVVRIYSKKVHFLYEDCNAVMASLRKAFASIDLNLPEDARQAPFQTITLPDTFDLDSLDLDDSFNLDGDHDHHLRSYDDITLIDQIPLETDLYVSISFDEVPGSNVSAADDNVLPPAALIISDPVPGPSNQVGEENIRNIDDNAPPPGPSNQSRHNSDNSPEDFPPEIMRDAVPEVSGTHPPLSCRNDIAEPQASLDEVLSEKDNLSPNILDDSTAGGQTLPFQLRSGQQASSASLQEDLENNIASVSYALRATPPVQERKARPRKRKQYYDEAPVLTNVFMRKALKNTSDLVCKRRKIPESALGIWKLEKSLRKEEVFFEPSITGLCSDLCNIFNKDYISLKLQSLDEAYPDSTVVGSPVLATEASLETRFAQSPASPAPVTATEALPQHEGAQFRTPMNDDVQEIEHCRDVVSHDEGNSMREYIPSPKVTPSFIRDDISPSSSIPIMEPTGTGLLPTPDLPASTGLGDLGLETPDAYMGEQTTLENTGLSDVPESINYAETDDLFFLEADNNTPTGSQGTQGVDSLSVRTRAVAQYLKRQSSIIPISEDLSGDLSLKQLLEGRTRKLCARMFFETLVLKSSGLVDVQQDVPYGDITLKLTPQLKAQI